MSNDAFKSPTRTKVRTDIIMEADKSKEYVGQIMGVPVDVDENCPPGKVFFLNSEAIDFMPKLSAMVETPSRWQRIRNKVRKFIRGVF